MEMKKLTQIEMLALRKHWGILLRQTNGTVEGRKGNCWGVLYTTIDEARKNAQMIIEKSKSL